MTMKVLVTGGTGFVGTRLIPQLIADGHSVFALSRSASSDEILRAAGATPVRGELGTGATLALPPLDAVVHAAAMFRFAGPRAPYFQANVTGTNEILKAAQEAGAKTFVHFSSSGVIMDNSGSPVRNADESAPTYPNSFSGYVATKARSEAAVIAANKPGFRTIALRPSAIWGPGDPFSRDIPDAIKSGSFAFFDRGDFPFSTCNVDNVIEAVKAALERGEGGRAYFVNDRETTTFRQFIAMIATAHGTSIEKVRSIPYWLAFNLGRLMEFGASVIGSKKDPPLSRSLVRMIGREFTTNDAAARRDLGYQGNVSRTQGTATYHA
jgi:nucleoside-diphosphate-sugar epimerase